MRCGVEARLSGLALISVVGRILKKRFDHVQGCRYGDELDVFVTPLQVRGMPCNLGASLDFLSF